MGLYEVSSGLYAIYLVFEARTFSRASLQGAGARTATGCTRTHRVARPGPQRSAIAHLFLGIPLTNYPLLEHFRENLPGSASRAEGFASRAWRRWNDFRAASGTLL